MPELWRQAPVVKFCSIADELDVSLLSKFENSLVAGTIQGLLRTWDKSGRIRTKLIDWKILESLDLVFLSKDDLAGIEMAVHDIVRHCPMVVITDGSNDVRIYFNGNLYQYPTWKVRELDPTGAGDIFATTYLIHYWKTKDIAKSAAMAHSAASFIVESVGISIPSKEQIQERYKQYLNKYSSQSI